MRNKAAAVILATTALLGTSASIADAATPAVQRIIVRGPFATQDECNATRGPGSGGSNETIGPCFFSQDTPPMGNPGPGWFFVITFFLR